LLPPRPGIVAFASDRLRAGDLKTWRTHGALGPAANCAGNDIAVPGETGWPVPGGLNAAVLRQEVVDTVGLVHRRG